MNALPRRAAAQTPPPSSVWLLLLLLTTLPATVLGAEGKGALQVSGRSVELAVRPVTESIVRITVSPLLANGTAAPLANESVLVPRRWVEPVIRVRRRNDRTEASAGRLHVTADASISIRVKREGQLVQHLRIDRDSGRVTFLAGPGPVLGLGQGGPQFDRRRTIYPMLNDMHAWDMKHLGGRMPIPWLVGTDGWGLFLHEPPGRIELWSKRKGSLVPERGRSLPIDLFVVASEQPAEILRGLAELTGYPSMPPIWKMGYTQSHRSLSGPEAVFDVAEKLRQRRLPCDALCYLGSGFVRSGWNTGHGKFAWNARVFPDPEDTIAKLHAMHFRVMLHVWGPPKTLHGSVDEPGGAGQADHCAAYWASHRQVNRLVDAWWPDGGEELSVASRLARHRMYYEGSQRERPDVRPFSLHRTGYAGMQRFGGWLWTGDPYSTWETLKQHVPVGVNTSLSGVPFWGTDAGGFHPTKEYTGELYVRWFQLAAFCPQFRSHGISWHLHTPWGWNTGTLGPQEADSEGKIETEEADVGETRNPLVEPICRKYLELRYRLLPYNYTICRETCETGMPMIRALWLHYPEDPKAVAMGNQYLWGPNILVAPVTAKGATRWEVYLPRGEWYDFWSEKRLVGGRSIEREVDLATMPLYVRAGSIVPLGPVKQYTTQPSDEPVTLVVYPGEDGSFTLHEDDGLSFDHRDGEFSKTRIGWNDADRRLSLSLVEGKLLPPESRRYVIRLAGSDSTREIVFEGQPQEIRLPPA